VTPSWWAACTAALRTRAGRISRTTTDQTTARSVRMAA
jgi:hypothetical protein